MGRPAGYVSWWASVAPVHGVLIPARSAPYYWTTGALRALLPAAIRKGQTAGLGQDWEAVLAADAVAEAADVGAVHMHGDGHVVAGVANAVDVAGRGEAAHGPGRVHVAGGERERAAAVGEGEDLLVLEALQDGGHAPGHVVVDHGLLPGQPDHGCDRERAVGLGVEQMTLIAGRVAMPKGRGQQVRRVGKVAAEGADDAIGCLLPAQAQADFGPDRSHEAVRTRSRDHRRAQYGTINAGQ